ncbi:hypothetical protein OGAPHI_003736 [Ogataea philodendri]|uniref:Proteasome subunit beta n=1 Tax=Ogataea philodendri TaxID=1378263 RepID=A0A9P8P5D7_9ASCO|nr:uncharacterized protein OGAPHI_003736 [Ogataea philodendri]KAH3665550.1 hypothetical protein OGAPHI_003736 [Ogataea philodendri]
MNHDPFQWGKPLDSVYGPYNAKIAHATNKRTTNIKDVSDFPTMHTQQPMITGTSVISVRYQDGVVLAADNMGAYGSLMKLDDVERIVKVGKDTIVGISGDISDMQHLHRILDDLVVEDRYDMESDHLKANHVHEYLTRVLYNRRTKMDPLWNACIVAGFDEQGEVFLKYVDLLGVTYTSPALATGFGAHLAIPLLRKKADTDEDVKNLTKEDAVQLVKDCMKVLFYRDARSLDKYTLCVVEKSTKQIEIQKDVKCEDMKWGFAKDISGYGLPQL